MRLPKNDKLSTEDQIADAHFLPHPYVAIFLLQRVFFDWWFQQERGLRAFTELAVVLLLRSLSITRSLTLLVIASVHARYAAAFHSSFCFYEPG